MIFHWYYCSFTGINVLSVVLLFIVFVQICLIFFCLIFKCHINWFCDGILEPGVKMFKVQILVLEDPLFFFLQCANNATTTRYISYDVWVVIVFHNLSFSHFTPQYTCSWNIAEVGVKHQSINQSLVISFSNNAKRLILAFTVLMIVVNIKRPLTFVTRNDRYMLDQYK